MPLVKDTKELFLIFESLSSFFLKYDRDCSSVEELQTYFLSQNVGLSSTDKDYYASIFENIRSSEVSSEVVDGLLGAIRRKATLTHLAVAAYEAAEGRRDYAEVQELLATLQQDGPVGEEGTPLPFCTDDLEEIYKSVIQAPGLRWRLKSLNQAIGSLRQGNFGFVFARPETGKTTFLASEITHMASQASGPVIWFNNEQPGKEVTLRIYQASLGATLEQLFVSIPKAKGRYKEVTKGNIKLVDQAVLHKNDVERTINFHKPALVVFDQIDKITGFAADRDDLVLGAIYQWARELAKKHCPVIGVCQADGTAEGVKWLTMAHVANAKTSKQAEADWILGIGRSNDAGYEDVRHFNISKNKLIGDADSLPEMRHGKWDVLIEPTVARYKDIVA